MFPVDDGDVGRPRSRSSPVVPRNRRGEADVPAWYPAEARMHIVTAVILLALALALVGGGAWLIALGGSWYYLVAGLAFAATGLLLLRGRPQARLVYALLLLGTLAWALWEVGPDWWPLGTRGGLPVLLGLWLLTPWTTRQPSGWDLGRRSEERRVGNAWVSTWRSRW